MRVISVTFRSALKPTAATAADVDEQIESESYAYGIKALDNNFAACVIVAGKYVQCACVCVLRLYNMW